MLNWHTSNDCHNKFAPKGLNNLEWGITRLLKPDKHTESLLPSPTITIHRLLSLLVVVSHVTSSHLHTLGALGQLCPFTTITLRYTLTQLGGKLISIAQHHKLLARLLGHNQLHCVKQPTHDHGYVDEELPAQGLRVVTS